MPGSLILSAYVCSYYTYRQREQREGWPLLTVETEANGNSKSTGSSFLGWFVELVIAVQEIFCPAQDALVGPVQNISFSHQYTISIHLSPLPSKLGRQSCWVACHLKCVCVILPHPFYGTVQRPRQRLVARIRTTHYPLWRRLFLSTDGSRGRVHRKKRFTSFPSPAGMSLTKLPLDRTNSVMTSLFPPRESLVVTSRLGTGNSQTFFLRCSCWGGSLLTGIRFTLCARHKYEYDLSYTPVDPL